MSSLLTHDVGSRTELDSGPERSPARRLSLAWRRLPALVEIAIVVAGYCGYALVRLGVRADQHAAFAHADDLWRAERHMHLTIEPFLNHLVAARPLLAELTGYYYGLLHFIVTPLVLLWLYLRRPDAFGHLRSALVVTTTIANVVFWTWPVAPPRFSVPGMTDVLVHYHILGSGNSVGPDRLVNLYAAMPSLHVAWATWCAVAVFVTTRSRWRYLAWLYPAASTFVVLASANHFLLDTVGGLAVTGLGLLLARPRTVAARPATVDLASRPAALNPAPVGSAPVGPAPVGSAPVGPDDEPVIGRPPLPRHLLTRRTGTTAVSTVRSAGRRPDGARSPRSTSHFGLPRHHSPAAARTSAPG